MIKTIMQSQIITIALSGSIEGHAITPNNVRLGDLAQFADDAKKLLQGNGKEVDANNLLVSIQHGSMALVTESLYAPKLFDDLRRLKVQSILDGRIDPVRRAVIQSWQQTARKFHDLKVRISADFLKSPLIISADTDYHYDDANHWVQVERYIQGVIEDLGGAKKPNAHIRLADGRHLTVSADKDLLGKDTVNRLYKPAMLRIRADYNIITRDLRNIRLLHFVEHSHALDEAQFKRMTERGRGAWQGIHSATEWVDELRGAIH